MKTAAGLKYLFTAVGLRLTVTRNRLHKYFFPSYKRTRNPMHSVFPERIGFFLQKHYSWFELPS